MDRRLTAILAADVVGYSRLMGIDEAATLDALNAHRRELIDQKIAEHHGRIVKLVGDGILAEFPSVVNAVACAAEIQRGMLARNLGVADDRRIVFRMGVNLGDVIVEGEDIFGDGVNVAARLESVARPGGIAVSASVRDQVGERLALVFEDSGEHTLKNIARPIRVFHVRLEEEPATSASPTLPLLPVPSKPSIAVLPFTNMSGDPEQDYFADGLVEDLITNLSKMPGFFVIARNSTFAYKGKAVDIRKIAAELGVRYVLEGSVRKAANRVRITGQLVEGAGATHVWADKFEGGIEDIFDLQDRLTESIVGALEPTLRRAEIERARSKRPDTLDAYDFYLRALPYTYANTPADNEEALRLLDEALRLDPGYAVAHAYAAWCREQRFLRGGFRPEDKAAALSHAHAALTAGADDSQALSIAAFIQANLTHDYESGITTLGRAIEMNPNSALALGFSSIVLAFSEHYDQAIENAHKALRLSPFDPLNYHPYLALTFSHFLSGRFDEAVTAGTLALQVNPNFTLSLAMLVAAYSRLGNPDAAGSAATRLLQIAPDWTIDGFVRMELVRPPLLAAIAEALRKAGLPA